MSPTDTPCIEWSGRRDKDGYGRRGSRLAHRVAYEEQVGPIPEGMELDHTCRNRACVNVLHLEVVTHRENTLRGDTIPARHAEATHCPQGHPYSPENTLRRRNGWRVCRMCKRAAGRARAQRPEVKRRTAEATRRYRARQKAVVT